MRWLVLLMLSGCAASPAMNIKISGQINPWSDWVLQPERDWTPDESETRINVLGGFEWDNGLTCGADVRTGS